MTEDIDAAVYNQFLAAVKEHRYALPKDVDWVGALERYTLHRIKTGSLLYFVLCNDWYEAIMHAHFTMTVEDLRAVTRFVEAAVPAEARGSAAAVEAWIAKRTATEEKS